MKTSRMNRRRLRRSKRVTTFKIQSRNKNRSKWFRLAARRKVRLKRAMKRMALRKLTQRRLLQLRLLKYRVREAE